MAKSIKIENVGKYFGSGADEVKALDNVSLEIAGNEFFTLLGPSGCGKTTLLRMIAGFEKPTFGNIFLDEKDLTLLPPYLRPVNTVFQSYALFPHMSVARNIAFGLEMLKKPKDEIAKTVDEMLGLVHMTELKHRRTDQISGGQQQRVALARALAPKPDVLLLDEPLSALDYKLRRGMQIELKRLQLETGITFVFVTHDQEEALTMSDRIAVMDAGRILQIGTPDEIYKNPHNRFVAGFIGESNFMQGTITAIGKARGKRAGDTAKIRLAATRKGTGHDISVSIPRGMAARMNGSGEKSVTVFIRPEHARLVKTARGATLSGRLVNKLFFGTDTNYHLELGNGEMFVVRGKGADAGGFEPQIGDTPGIILDENALKILEN